MKIANLSCIMHDHYTGTVEMEALCLSDMLLHQHIIPSIKKTGLGPLAELEACVPKLKAAVAEIHAAQSSYDKVKLARVLRLETMIEMRDICESFVLNSGHWLPTRSCSFWTATRLPVKLVNTPTTSKQHAFRMRRMVCDGYCL